MGNVCLTKETEIRLSNQRNKFLGIIVVITLIGIGFVVSTTVLALKVKSSYPSAHVEYHVWNHQDALKGTRQFQKFKVPHNATFFTLMEHAHLEGGSPFRYDYKQFEFGKYITSIGGTRESVVENLFWMLYKLTDSPDPNGPPSLDLLSDSDMGVDGVRVKDGEVYLFWLTKMDYSKSASNRTTKLGSLSKPCSNLRVL